MYTRLFIFISSILFTVVSSPGQCPDRDSLWTRLIFLRDSAFELSPAEKLKELLVYDARIKTCSYRGDSTQALLMQRIGAMYFYQADFFNAARYMRQAANIIAVNSGKPSVNIRHNIRNYYSLGWIYDSLGNVSGKMKALDSCAAVALRCRSSDIYCIRSLSAIGEYLYDMGDYHRCIEYATINERVAREYAKNGTSKDEQLVGLQYSLWSLFLKINALLVLQDYETAEEMLIARIDECKKNNLKGYLGTIYQQLAKVQLKRGNGGKALLYYNEAFRYEKEAGDNMACMAVLNQIGYEVYFKLFHDANKALVHCRKALFYVNKTSFDNTANVFVSLNAFSNIGNIYASKGLYDYAFIYFQRAFDQMRPGMNERALLNSSAEEFSKNKSVHYLVELLISKGNTFVKLFKASKKPRDLAEAIQIYKVTDQLLDRIKSAQTELESKLFWRSNSRNLYENAIEACFLEGNAVTAFYFFEKSRAILLNDQLAEQRWMGQDDIMKQAQLKKKEARLKTESDTINKVYERYAALQTEMVINKQERDQLLRTIKDRNPLYYQSFIDTGLISLQDVREKILKDHEAILELFYGDSAVYSLLITPKQIFLYHIPKPEFEKTVQRYNYYLSDPVKMNVDYEGYTQTAFHLYRLIFQNNPVPNGRIIISPGGQYFPFESLVMADANQSPAFFLYEHSVSYTYSAGFLLNNFNPISIKTGKNFLGIAPVKYPVAFSLAALPGSDHSLQKISGYFSNAVNQLTTDASRMNFLQQFSQYRIIQLYTHASGSSSKNNEPVIYFADSALYLSDLINEFKPNTRLIVLSACETGTGKIYHGEGVFSFNRGFAALGIPAAVTNLWSVDNISTYKLTELFYKELAKGFPTDVALQKAKLEFLKTASKEKSMPCYWAGPVLVGKTDTIELSKLYPWKWIILFAGIGCFVFLALRKRNLLKFKRQS